ncbi:MAG: hypothetical protein K9W44_01325 [Candidatus Lokiarchaeota archaeon]|nr:hypothetical protein [Candidatus Harpocratesius repetitus]
MSRKNNRLNQLKFISNIFQMSLKEIKDTLGFETLTMIFRRVGEAAADLMVPKLEGKYSTMDEFANLLITYIVEPILGPNQGKIQINENKIDIQLNACPYKRAGHFPIQDMDFFCHYTEGLFDQAFKLAFPDKNFDMEAKELIAKGCKHCIFEAEFI